MQQRKVLFVDIYQPIGWRQPVSHCSETYETYKFTGKPVSTTTGLYYYYQRWYDPSIGRFISPDPKHGKLPNPQSLNLYIYVLDAPTSLTDPSGLDSCGWNPLSWGGCVNNATQAVSNWWNSQDQSTKIAIIAVLATVAIVATAGAAAPALLPLIATGIALGASTSVAGYAVSTVASGGSITVSGLLKSAAIGGFFGAVSFGTYGAVGVVASAAGLGPLASFVVSGLASVGASKLASGLLGPGSSMGDPSQLDSNLRKVVDSVEPSNIHGPSGPCQAALGVVGLGMGAMAIGHGLIVVADGDPQLEKIGGGFEWGGLGLSLAGIGLAIGTCGGQ